MSLKNVAHIRQIDALRGIAAATIAFVYHQFYLLGPVKTGPLDGLPIFSWLHQHGYTMVDLFFVISGFVFSHVYLTPDRQDDALKARNFFLARFARLYPLHLATLFLVIPALLAGTVSHEAQATFDLRHFVLNLFMLQQSGLNDGFSYNIPSWSISVEIFCYIGFFLFVTTRHPRILQAVLLLCLAGIMWVAGDNASVQQILRGAIGFLMGHIAWKARELALPRTLLVAIVAVPFLFVDDTIRTAVLLSFTSWPALLLLVIRSRSLTAPWLHWLGARSYALYLLHTPVYLTVSAFAFDGRNVPPALAWPALAASWAMILLLSEVSYRYLEIPAKRTIRGAFSYPRTSQGGSPSPQARGRE